MTRNTVENVDANKLDVSKLQTMSKLDESIKSLEESNLIGEFDGEITMLKSIKANVSASLFSGEAKLAAEILN